MRRSMNGVVVYLSAAALAIASVACSNSTLDSPTAPSAETASVPTLPAPRVSTGASIAGSVIATATTSLPGAKALTIMLTVRIAGTSIEAAVASPGYFELHDVPTGDIQLQFVGAGIDAVLPIEGVKALERIELDVAVGGSSAVIERTNRETAVSEKTIAGIVADLAGACPNLTFALDGTPVLTNEQTVFAGNACAKVRNGDKRSVTGSRNEGRLTARYVSTAEGVPSKNEREDEEEEQPREVTLAGSVSGLGGTCPALTFTVNGQAVKTSSSTTFSREAGCGDVKNGASVGVAGTKGTDGRVQARYVSVSKVEPKPEAEIVVTGTIDELTGACPSRKFLVRGKSAATTSATIFGGGTTCADLKSDEKWGGAGTKNGDGVLVMRYMTKL